MAAILFTAGTLHAQFVSFSVGMNRNGGIGIVNTSSPGFTLNSVSITLSNDTFFDTTNTPPGTFSFSWATAFNSGLATIELPSNESTDGQQTAAISFTGFDPSDFVRLSFDLDNGVENDGLGDLTGAQITATFTGGVQAIAALTATSASVAGATYSDTGSASQAVPEPTSLLLVGVGLSAFLLRRRRH